MNVLKRPHLSSTTKAFAGNSLIYLLGNVLAKLVGFILLPLYTAKISPTDFGYYDLSITYVTIAATALFFDMWISTMRFMHDSGNPAHKSKVIRSAATLFTFSTVFYLLLGFAVSFFVDVQYVGLIIAYGLASNIATMYGFIARGFGKNKSFAVSGIISAFTTGAISATLLLVFNMDFSALYIAAISGFIVQVAYLEVCVGVRRQILQNKLDKKLTIELFKNMLPLIVNSSAFWLLTGYNRVVISNEMPLSENGIYAIAARFIVVVTLITTVFNFAWQDTLFTKAAKKQLQQFYSKSSNFYALLLLAGGAALLPAIWIGFDFVIAKEYQAAKYLVPPLVITALMTAYIAYQGSLFHSLKKTAAIFYSMVIASIVNIALCLPLVREFGLNGATFATIIGFSACIIIRIFTLNRHFSYKFDFLILVGLALFIVSVYAYMAGNTLTNSIALVLTGPISLGLIVIRYNTYSRKNA